ncbi:hypothetical protein Fcan01_25858 [Folsomia candida]|uniref:Uncharacterized protein n=1 Tax=Folsomia candida TaxID=158441 RepID=A0A226D3M3_FOLCA|nr:hypothetical protein Fcan01_25858 [Folsomia candida]
MSPPGQESPTATGITYAATIVVTGFVPMVWNLKKSSGPRNALSKLPPQPSRPYGRQGLQQADNPLLLPNLLHGAINIRDHLRLPVSPVYTTILSILNVLSKFHKFRKFHIVKIRSKSSQNFSTVLIILLSGAPTSLGGAFLMATMASSSRAMAWSPSSDTAFHVYNSLRHVMMLYSEIARNFVAICLHHVTLVVMSMGALYSMITELAKGNEMSVILVFSCRIDPPVRVD